MSFDVDIVISLVHGLGLMALIALAFGTLEALPISGTLRSILNGAVFGCGAVAAMISPAIVGDGIIIDARSVIVGLAGAFAGAPAAIVATALAGVYRLWLGGTGAPVGAIGIVISGAVGYWWGYGRLLGSEARRRDLALLGLALSSHILTFLLLPVQSPFEFLLHTSLAMVAAYIVAAVVMGSMMQRERNIILREKALRLDALTDPLTGLANRRAFETALNRAMASHDALQGLGLSLLVIDIDHFKAVNDTLGHDVGDEALKIVAKVLRSCLREGDFVARHGGEEFAVILPRSSLMAGCRIAERIRADLAASDMTLQGRRLALTGSVGIASSLHHGRTAGELLAAADGALYAAKKSGRNQIAIASRTRAGEHVPMPVGAASYAGH